MSDSFSHETGRLGARVLLRRGLGIRRIRRSVVRLAVISNHASDRTDAEHRAFFAANSEGNRAYSQHIFSFLRLSSVFTNFFLTDFAGKRKDGLFACTGRSAAWLAHWSGGPGVGGSNPLAPIFQAAYRITDSMGCFRFRTQVLPV